MKSIVFDRNKHLYKSDTFAELIKDAIRFFNGTPVQMLPPPDIFLGTGVYALYYIGQNPVYRKYTELNRLAYNHPLYIGKAVPKGWRQARVSESSINQSRELYNRLKEHSRSITVGYGLSLEDFMCRFIIFEDEGSDMISTIEAALIKLNQPLWNVALDGFGNHDPGRGRYEQAKSDWDVIHPGRIWADRCKGIPTDESTLRDNIDHHFQTLGGIMMNSLELFSGAGGLAKGLALAGFNHAALVEINKHAYESLCQNFDSTKVFWGDVRDFDVTTLNDIDLVSGGPPCQPFSLGGKHQAERDSRDMFPSAIDAIAKLKPKVFVFENVKGLLRQSFVDYFEYIILRLTYPSIVIDRQQDWRHHLGELLNLTKGHSSAQYNVSYRLLNAANYGVPQKRERVFIVGVRNDLRCSWSFPPETHSADKLFWDMYVTGEYWERHAISKSQRPLLNKSLQGKVFKLKEKYGMVAPLASSWQTIRDAISNLPDPHLPHGICDHVFRHGARSYPGHTGSVLDSPAKTIKAGDHGVPGGENMICFPSGEIRYMTVLEAKRLQTFPDDFAIQGTWGEAMRQIGNAVPVLLAEKIGLSLLQTLKTHQKSRSVAFAGIADPPYRVGVGILRQAQ